MSTSAAIMLLSDKENEKYDLLAVETRLVIHSFTSKALASQPEANTLAELLARGKVAWKDLEELRDTLVRPLNQQVRTINALFADQQGPLEDLERRGKKLLDTFRAEERTRIQREQEEARRRQEEAARKEAEAKERIGRAATELERQQAMSEAQAASHELSVATIEEPREAPKHIRTDTGTALSVKRWTFEVVSPDLVPREYLSVDEKKLRAAVQAGARQIAGVNVFEEETTSVRIGR